MKLSDVQKFRSGLKWSGKMKNKYTLKNVFLISIKKNEIDNMQA